MRLRFLQGHAARRGRLSSRRSRGGRGYRRLSLRSELPRTIVRVRNSKNKLLKNQLTVFFSDITFNLKLQDQVSALKTLSLN